MKFYITLLLFISGLSGCSHHKLGARANMSAKETKGIGIEISKLIQNTDPNVNVGYEIISLDSGLMIAERNANRHYLPGSTIKLFTIAAALHYLGPTFRFTTDILADQFAAKEGRVKHLYLRGSGDPGLMDHHLLAMAMDLKQLGIKEISGNIYVDDQIFDEVQWGKGTMWDDRDRGFGAPISGLNLNYNRVQIRTTPAKAVGEKAISLINPPTSLFKLETRALTKERGASKLLTTLVERANERGNAGPLAAKDGLKPGDRLIIEGQTPLNGGIQYSMLSVNDPSIMAGSFLKDSLQALGIKISGQVLRAITPSNAIVLTSNQSRSLGEALIDYTKISNNVANDSLVKAMAAYKGQRPASYQAGLKLVGDFLAKEVGIDPASLVTADGAGLSRYNLVTPHQMVKLLNYADSNFHIGPELWSSLPISGLDGTLTGKFKGKNLTGNIRAKSGSMTGISCLGGFFVNNVGERFAFSIMINGFVGSTNTYNLLHEEILATLLNDDLSAVARKP